MTEHGPRLTSRGIVTISAILTAAGVVTAAVAVQVPPSTLNVGVVAPPLKFTRGDQAGDTLYVRSFALSANASTFSATLRGVPQATVVIPSLATLTNMRATTQNVTVTAPQATAAAITALELEFRDEDIVLGKLDLRSKAPSTSFSLPGGRAATIRTTLGLAEGAGAHNVDVSFALQVVTSG